jgi:hypothetical protein
MESVKHGVDAVGAMAVLLNVIHALPDVLAAIASLVTIIWYGIRIHEWRKGK